jgi:transposase-like protein
MQMASPDKPTPLGQGKIICPRCSDPACRVKRTLRDRFMGLFKPFKRYRCDYCGWSGTV